MLRAPGHLGLHLDHRLPHQFGSTMRRQPGILMNVHPVLREDAKASQLQLPRSDPDGQPIEIDPQGVSETFLDDGIPFLRAAVTQATMTEMPR